METLQSVCSKTQYQTYETTRDIEFASKRNSRDSIWPDLC